MVWSEQDPPATDVLLHVNVPCSGGGSPAYLEIDKLPDGTYRATVGTLFEHQEICRSGCAAPRCSSRRAKTGTAPPLPTRS
jgi:hypothetical protein